MRSQRKEIIKNNKISELYEWELSGYKQKVLIEGKQSDFPVVLTLHGGPGTPIPFSVGCRGMFPEFTDKFVMVYWDQLGCGINNYIIDDSFNIDLFVSMTQDLIYKIKEMFPNNKIYIFSMSWGTVLSAEIIEKSSSVVDGVVAWGQIVKDLVFNDEVIAALESSKLSRKKLDVIRNTKKENASPKELQLATSCIRKYTNGFENKNGEKAPVGKIIKGLLTSPDYKFRDFKAIMMNGYRKNQSLWKELLSIDLSDGLCNVKIPYLILQGDTDIVTSTQTVINLTGTAGNPYLKCEIVRDSGHMPGKEGMEKVLNLLESLERICL